MAWGSTDVFNKIERLFIKKKRFPFRVELTETYQYLQEVQTGRGVRHGAKKAGDVYSALHGTLVFVIYAR
jgi:hypothetical protein